jgi:hypothetical protein
MKPFHFQNQIVQMVILENKYEQIILNFDACLLQIQPSFNCLNVYYQLKIISARFTDEHHI